MSGLTGVIDAAIADRHRAFDDLPLAGGRAVDRGPGLVELIPDARDDTADAPATIISAGIHGDETAPLELVARLAAALDAGKLLVGAPVLLIIGHPAAIVAETRYIQTNLNRLFQRRADTAEADSVDGLELRRAAELMAAVDAFWATHHASGGAALHLDLHTAIRPSRYPCFAVEPSGPVVTPAPVWQAMAAAGLSAVVTQTEHSWTFSHYSRHYHAVPAFTIELGQVARFGENDPSLVAPMQAWLADRIAARTPARAAISDMCFFRAEAEIRRVGGAFCLMFDDTVPNFTVFAPGTVLAHDDQAGESTVGDTPVAVIFPNARVEQGARAALLAVAVDPPAQTAG